MTISHRSAFDIIIVVAVFYLCGCASAIHGTKQQVRIETKPPGAIVTILPEQIDIIAPAEVELERKKVHTAFAKLDGYSLSIGYLDRVTSWAIYGNLVLGGFIGLSVDAENGAGFRLTPDPLIITLTPLEEKAPIDPSPKLP